MKPETCYFGNIVVPDAWIIEEAIRRERARKEREKDDRLPVNDHPWLGDDPYEEWVPDKNKDTPKKEQGGKVIVIDI